MRLGLKNMWKRTCTAVSQQRDVVTVLLLIFHKQKKFFREITPYRSKGSKVKYLYWIYLCWWIWRNKYLCKIWLETLTVSVFLTNILPICILYICMYALYIFDKTYIFRQDICCQVVWKIVISIIRIYIFKNNFIVDFLHIWNKYFDVIL